MVPSQFPSAGKTNINFSAVAKKIDVDNRISLRFYYRIADNILKQANIFREEHNVIDLYVMLLRFSSLVTETIPCHRDYRKAAPSNKIYQKKLIAALTELEELKPAVLAKLQELQNKTICQPNKPQHLRQDRMLEYSQPSINQTSNGWNTTKPLSRDLVPQRPKALVLANPGAEHLRKFTLSIPRPKEETLSKHSILGPAGLSGRWQPPSNLKVQYPSTVDLTPLQFPRDCDDLQSVKDGSHTSSDNNISGLETLNLDSVVLQPKIDDQLSVPNQDSDNLISFDSVESTPQTVVVRQPSPPPVLADVEDLIPTPSPNTQIESVSENATKNEIPCVEDPLQLHISTELMNSFMKLAKSNTDRNLETCGVLAGSLKNRKFYITALIIPKQESTSDSCQTTNEEEIFEVQDKQSLFPLGWIHTHPTQSCFMSSIDVHTHYSYQIMLPESIAIVMAPKDTSRKHGIFRLTSGGMTVIRQCPRRGFHGHDPPSDGGPIYRQCTDVYMNSSLKFQVIDLR